MCICAGALVTDAPEKHFRENAPAAVCLHRGREPPDLKGERGGTWEKSRDGSVRETILGFLQS